MKKYWKAITNIVIALVCLLLAILLIPRLLVFFAPFVAAWIVAAMAGPLVRFFEEKLKIKRKAGSAFVIVVVLAILIFLIYLGGAKLGREVISFINSIPEMWAGAEEDFRVIGEKLDVLYSRLPVDLQDKLSGIANNLVQSIGNIIGQIGSPTLEAVGNFAKSLPSVLIGVVMGLLSSYFFVAERAEINAWFREHIPENLQRQYMLVKKSMVRAVGGYLKAQLKIEIWMYLLLVIGLSILRVNYAFLIAIGIAFLDILPFFGTGTVLVPWALIKLLSSDYVVAIGLFVLWGVGQLARQLIQPKIVGDSIGVPAIPTLFLLYIGYKLSGVVGMIVAVPIGLILITMYEEGVFDTTKNSIRILVHGVNRFRKLTTEDLKELTEGNKKENQ
ncbi:MAG: sporulation integral membrane protein YtvI [Acetatifactor sp.]|nr:sporulation integral membrane protein YtvI [Acetatifactor sp.]